jgi:hypothetical protein
MTMMMILMMMMMMMMMVVVKTIYNLKLLVVSDNACFPDWGL